LATAGDVEPASTAGPVQSGLQVFVRVPEQPVVPAAQMCALVREDGAQLAFIERVDRAPGDHDAASMPGQQVGASLATGDTAGAKPVSFPHLTLPTTYPD